MSIKPASLLSDRFVTGLFQGQRAAESAFHTALRRGYDAADISVIMSEETRQQLLSAGSSLAHKAPGDTKDAESTGDEVSGPVGATVATVAPALAAVGTVLLVPGVIALGPVAIALAAAGAMGLGAGLVGALTHWGIPSAQVGEYDAGIRRGGILLAVKPRTKEDASQLVEAWKANGGESVHS